MDIHFQQTMFEGHDVGVVTHARKGSYVSTRDSGYNRSIRR